ncbi:MAG TPA: DUF4263 domain-containing protein [Oscillatoriaceae cyanobacterium M33_DOE_052]|uniref:DUF4263 domain-containing protein n=1 Tax=Planktothricoides sp. SpSt-374 TaxID=2282167 RepID=A0A7C3VGN1_9CYAN|nr:DUF4263 domain-containing protein [Oscillatoriaceae cyanobacterium M33_DOE_052]
MKNLSQFKFNPGIGFREFAELQQLLQSRRYLSERDDILPFFRQREHLSAFLSYLHPRILRYDRIAFEFDIFGDFKSDLVVGDSVTQSYFFVEFEDAGAESIFLSNPNRSTPEWAPRFERGFSQIIDWFCKLDEMEKTDSFEDKFGSRSIDYMGLLVIGRSHSLSPRERRRLKWRRENTVVNSKHIYCMTFDELSEDLQVGIEQYQFVNPTDN